MRVAWRPLVLIAAAGLLVWGGWLWLAPSDEARIRAVFERLSEAAAVAGDEGDIGRLARASLISRELAPDLIVDAGPPLQSIRGREAIVSTFARLDARVHNLEIRFHDIAVAVSPDRQTATAVVTAEARYVEPGGGRGIDARELEVGFRRLDGHWVISSVIAAAPLKRPDRE